MSAEENINQEIILQTDLGHENTKQKGTIKFNGINKSLLSNVEKHVRLAQRLRGNDEPPISKGERQRLEARVILQIKQALEPFGYYRVSVNADLSDAPNYYRYNIQLNEPLIVNQVEIKLNELAESETLFNEWRNNFPIKKGDRLDQAVYVSAKKSLMSIALSDGYFDANLVKNKIGINEERTKANILLDFDSGQRYKVGEIAVSWNTSNEKLRARIEKDIINTLLSIQKGDFVTTKALTETQKKLLATTYFSGVDVRAGEGDPTTGLVPIEVSLTPAKRKAYSISAGIGTDTGVRGSIGFQNRRINNAGHHVNARLGGSEIERVAIVNYRIPLTRSDRDSLNFFALVDEEFGDNRRFQSNSIGSEWTRKWDEALLKFSITASREKFLRFSMLDNGLDLIETEQSTDLLLPGIGWERNKADDLYYPTRGWSASLLFQAANKSAGSDIDLAQAVASAKYISPFLFGRIKLRFKVAGTIVDEAINLPESLGFLAGGDDSIRGYSFESIGVERDGQISVAKNITVGSLEYQHPIKEGIYLASFLDIGDAFDSSPSYKKGAGLGVRWRLPFGSMRLDAASALDIEGNPIRFHFSFGTDL